MPFFRYIAYAKPLSLATSILIGIALVFQCFSSCTSSIRMCGLWRPQSSMDLLWSFNALLHVQRLCKFIVSDDLNPQWNCCGISIPQGISCGLSMLFVSSCSSARALSRAFRTFRDALNRRRYHDNTRPCDLYIRCPLPHRCAHVHLSAYFS